MEVPAAVRRIVRRLARRGFASYVVGGAVRELLAGRLPNDWDVATAARPQEVQGCFRRVLPVGLRHGTVLVVEAGLSVQVSTFRQAGFSYGAGTEKRSGDLGGDLACRDFTLNAMALDPQSGAIIDPHDGRGDLRRGRLRADGDPAQRFAEDPVRVLRAARFVATHGWRLEAATRRAMPSFARRLQQVAPERIRQELKRLLLAPRPSSGLEIMRRSGQLEALLPELAACVGVRENHYHAYDVYRHTLRCLDAVPARAVLRWTALLHDIGKPTAKTRPTSHRDRRVHFYGHERHSLRLAEDVLRRLRSSAAAQGDILHVIQHHLIGYCAAWSDAAVRRFVRRVGEARVETLLAFARADALARGKGPQAADPIDELGRRVAEQRRRRAAYHRRSLALNGGDVQRLLGVGPGPHVGALLAELLDYVGDDPRRNTRRRLTAHLRRRAQSCISPGGCTRNA